MEKQDKKQIKNPEEELKEREIPKWIRVLKELIERSKKVKP